MEYSVSPSSWEDISPNDIWRVERERKLVHRTGGRRTGAISRVVSPSDLGQKLKPFIFLDDFSFDAGRQPLFGKHPHSGIATLTWLLQGGFRVQDSVGTTGELSAGDLEWMLAGRGAWHDASSIGSGPVRGLQLWLALPPTLELNPPAGAFVRALAIEQKGPMRLLLGSYEGMRGAIDLPLPLNYLSISLRKGEVWRYNVPKGHSVAWAYAATGRIRAAGEMLQQQLGIFSSEGSHISFVAEEDSEFVVGSAVPHKYPLVMGHYSVHTDQDALDQGEREILRVGAEIQARGSLAPAVSESIEP